MMFVIFLVTLCSHGNGHIDIIDANDDVITVIGSNRHTDHLDLMNTYPWYGSEHVRAIKDANDAYADAYVDALRMAKKEDSYYAYHRAVAIANTEFIDKAIAIRKNCTDKNNTLCQNDGKPDDVAEWTIYMPLAIVIIPTCLCCIYHFIKNCVSRIVEKDRFADLL